MRLALASLWFRVLVLLLLPCGVAVSEPVRSAHAEIELIAEYAVVSGGEEEFWAALRLRPDPGWYLYWRNPGDAGLPPELIGANGEVPELHWPLPEQIPVGNLMEYGYRGELILPFRLGASGFHGEASWLICKNICVPEQVSLSFEPVIGTKAAFNPASADLIASALSAVPQPFRGRASFAGSGSSHFVSLEDMDLAALAGDISYLRFFPYEHSIDHSAPQEFRFGEAGIWLRLASRDAWSGDALSGILAIEITDGRHFGLELYAVPGEVIAGTDSWPLLSSSSSAIAILLFFVTMAFLGGLVLNLMPCVLPVLAVKATALAATAPKDRQGNALAFMLGVVLCFAIAGALLIILRSAGEAVGLGFQLQYPAMTAGLAVLMAAIGYNLLGWFELPAFGGGGRLASSSGIAGSFWSGMLAALVGAPCTGPFMAAALAAVITHSSAVVMLVFVVMGFGMALPMTAIGFVPALALRLPRSGSWMPVFRRWLSLPMFLSGIWLVWVFAGQAGARAGLVLVSLLILSGLGLWRLSRVAGSWNRAGLILLVAVLGLGLASAQGGNPALAGAGTWSPESVAKAREQGRPVFVEFTARWCISCLVNKSVVLDNAKVKRAMARQDLLYLTADWTRPDPEIAAELARHDRAGIPLYLYYPPGAEAIILPQLLSPAIMLEVLEQGSLRSGLVGHLFEHG